MTTATRKDAGRRGMQPADVGALHHVEDPRLSPDGSLVAYVVNDVSLEENRYTRRLFLAEPARRIDRFFSRLNGELFVALRLLGREPVLVRFPGEHHDLSRSGAPKHRVERMEIILDWFRQHLG